MFRNGTKTIFSHFYPVAKLCGADPLKDLHAASLGRYIVRPSFEFVTETSISMARWQGGTVVRSSVDP